MVLSPLFSPPARVGVGAWHRSPRPDGQVSLSSLAPPLPNGPASLGSIWVPFSLCLVVLRGGLSRRGVSNTSPTEWVVLGGGDTRERTDFSPLGGKRGERTLGRRPSPSLTDSFAPFWSFRKGPAGGRSPSEMVTKRFSFNQSNFCLHCCPPCRGRSFLLVQKGTKDTPERGNSDFPPLWTLPLETAKHRGELRPPLLDVPPQALLLLGFLRPGLTS